VKILLTAYLNSNLGDDLFIKIICNRYPETKFILYGQKKYRNNFKDIENLIYISNKNFFRLIDKISYGLFNMSLVRSIISKMVDGHVYIGGSLFIQNDNWMKKYIEDNQKILQNKENFLIGCNFGPYSDESFLVNYKNILAKYNDVCFRDKKSFELFSDLKNIRYAPDVVFNLKVSKKHEQGKNVGISLIDLTNRSSLKIYKKDYLLKLKEITNYYISKGYKITIFSFCKNEGDETATNELMEMLGAQNNSISCYYYIGDITEAINKINDMDILIATRFHAMILGMLLRKKVLPLLYSEKMLTVLQDMDFNGDYFHIKDIKSLDINDINISDTELMKNIEKYIVDSKNQFTSLDRYIENKKELI
jgi:colanic acid/amylovoran biosynthesis protein